METNKVITLIEELKVADTQKEIKKIEECKDEITWSEVDAETQDLWYETLGDAKKGLYF
jgi:hypothetical protein